jgi:hypothetical protein
MCVCVRRDFKVISFASIFFFRNLAFYPHYLMCSHKVDFIIVLISVESVVVLLSILILEFCVTSFFKFVEFFFPRELWFLLFCLCFCLLFH